MIIYLVLEGILLLKGELWAETQGSPGFVQKLDGEWTLQLHCKDETSEASKIPVNGLSVEPSHKY